jgi:peptide/nickel transport system permease protein
VNDTIRFVAGRLAIAALFVLAVGVGAFALVRLAPGDATSHLVLTGADPATIASERARLGLDLPLPAHVARWLAGIARLDFGESSRFGRPVAGLVADRLGRTALLAAAALLLAVGIGLPLGVLSGTRQGSLLAGMIGVLSVAFLCCPPIIATLGLLLLAAGTGWLSIAPGDLGVPLLALALPLAATFERIQSQAAGEAFDSANVHAAAARGLPRSRLVWAHAARQSLRPVLGTAGVMIASLFSGSVVVEVITSWPGLGQLTLEALLSRDLYLIAGCAVAGASLVAVANFATDLLRAAADPRVRHST